MTKERKEQLAQYKATAEKVANEGKTVTPITSDDGKYTLYLRNPSRTEYGRFRSKMRSDEVEACEFLGNTCYVSGDREILDDDAYFFDAIDVILGIIQVKGISLGKSITKAK